VVGAVLAGRKRHRRFSDAQKTAIVGESFLPDVRVRDVMERHGLASSVIYKWRKQARQETISKRGASISGGYLIAKFEQRVATKSELIAQLPHALRWSPISLIKHDAQVADYRVRAQSKNW
jgi:transposase-like protein